MYKADGNPFDNIESAHEFVILLANTVCEAKLDMEAETGELNPNSPRHAQALRLALFNLNKLEFHLTRSRRILNDLRMLRRLLMDEQAASPLPQDDSRSTKMPDGPTPTVFFASGTPASRSRTSDTIEK
jgi:hypothetical protein